MKTKYTLLIFPLFFAIHFSNVLYAQNSITILDPPTSVAVGETVNLNISYTNTSGSAYVLVRFKSPSGDNLEQDFVAVGNGSAIESLSITAPSSAGGDYSLQAQLLRASDWGSLANYVFEGVAVGNDTAPPTGNNAITILNPPTSVAVGESVNLNISYTNTSGSAYVLVRFKSPSGDNLEQDFVAVGNGSGTEPLSIRAPSTTGSGYSLQAQLLRASDWGGLANYVFDEVTVGNGNTGTDSLVLTTTPSAISGGETVPITVSYNLNQTSIIYVQVFDNIGTPWNKIGEATVLNVPAGNGTKTIDVEIYGEPSANNRLEVRIYKPTNPWTPVDIDVPFENIPGDGEQVVFGLPANNDPSNTQYFDKNLYVAQGNPAYERNLSNKYWTNWYVSTTWQGPIKAYFGPAQNTAWVEWTNQKAPADDNQQEFDIKIQKYSWHSENDGYPTAINSIGNALNCESVGRWTEGSRGRGHINLTAWIYAGANPTGDKCDIIIHTWDNSGRLRQKYDNRLNYTDPDSGTVFRFRNIGTVTDNFGVTYQVLRTRPGGFNELASYNLVPDALIRNNPLAPFSTGEIRSRVGVRSIIDQVIALEASYDGARIPINSNWRLHGLEWTFTGQSRDRVDTDANGGTVYIPNSKGRFTFTSYSIPDITGQSSSLKAQIDSMATAEKYNDFTVSPNPFINSFEYEYSVEKNDAVTVDLYALDGRKIKTVKNSESHRAGNYSDVVDTDDLDAGIYILRVSSSEGDKVIKLIKN